MLYRQGPNWVISASGAPIKPGERKPGEGALKLDGMEARVDPRAEWKQMYHEVWRDRARLFLRSRISTDSDLENRRAEV